MHAPSLTRDKHRDKWGSTALMYACQQGDLEMVKILFNTCAKTDVQNIYGAMALAYARAGRHDAVVKLLVSAGACYSA